MKKERTQRLICAIMLFLIGSVIILVSLKIIPVDPKSLHAPYWVLFLVGMITLFTGFAVLSRAFSATSIFFVALATTIFAFVFTWAVLFGKNWTTESSLFFLPDAVNAAIGKVLLYSFAFSLWIVAFLVWSSFVKLTRKNGKQSDENS